MKLYGLAVAITGKNQPLVDVTCTTINIDEADPYRREILPAHSFTVKNLDPRNKSSLSLCFNRVASSLSSVVALQESALSHEGAEYRPVSFLVGDNGHIEYAVPDVIASFLKCAVPDDARESEQIKIGLQFAGALQKSYLRLGCYHREKAEYSEQDKKIGVDYRLKLVDRLIREQATRFNDPSTRQNTLEYLKEAAEWFGGMLADCYDGADATFVQIQAPDPAYDKNPELQAKNPVYSFAGWHPEIRHAVVKGFKKKAAAAGHPVTGNIYYKPNGEEQAPFFIDVITPMIWDQFDVLQGRNTPQNICYQDNPSYRQSLINRIRHSMPTEALHNSI